VEINVERELSSKFEFEFILILLMR